MESKNYLKLQLNSKSAIDNLIDGDEEVKHLIYKGVEERFTEIRAQI